MIQAGLLLALLPLGCGSAGEKTVPAIIIWNKTEYPLEEIRVHSDVSYAAAENLLVSPLANDGRTKIDPFTSGDHVTVMWRRDVSNKLIAYTSEDGIKVQTNCDTLKVFQDSFQLVSPPAGGDPTADGCSAGDP